MQIELIGCTNAGKSTLAASILRACRQQGVEISLAEDFVLKQLRLNWIKNRLLRRLLVNLIALIASLLTWKNNRQFYRFAAQLLFQLPIGRLEKTALFRNVLKKIGTYEIIRTYSAGQQIILVDEGVLQAAHNLFVHVSATVNSKHLSTFSELVPLPDAVVYLRQPGGLLIERIMNRGHKRIPDRSYSKVARFVEQAVTTFDKVAQHPAVEERLLIVSNDRPVNVVGDSHGSPAVTLATKIIRSGFISDRTNNSVEEIKYVEQSR